MKRTTATRARADGGGDDGDARRCGGIVRRDVMRRQSRARVAHGSRDERDARVGVSGGARWVRAGALTTAERARGDARAWTST